MAIKSVSNLRKFNTTELKNIMRKYKIKGLSGKKEQLVQSIRNNKQWNEIKQTLNIPVRKKRKFSPKQLAAQQAFKNRVQNKNKKKTIVKLELEDINNDDLTLEREMELLSLLKEEEKKLQQDINEQQHQGISFDIDEEIEMIDSKIRFDEILTIFENLTEFQMNNLLNIIYPSSDKPSLLVEDLIKYSILNTPQLNELIEDLELDIDILEQPEQQTFIIRKKFANQFLERNIDKDIELRNRGEARDLRKLKEEEARKPNVISKLSMDATTLLKNYIVSITINLGKLIGRLSLDLTKTASNAIVNELKLEILEIKKMIKKGISPKQRRDLNTDLSKATKNQLIKLAESTNTNISKSSSKSRIIDEILDSDDDLQDYIDENFGSDFIDIKSIN